jgi:transposase
MFLKRRVRQKNGERYEYWELVRTVRTASGPRHETVAYLGKLEEREARRRYGWSDIDALLEGREPDVQLTLDLPGARAEVEPEWRRVNVRGVRVERVREFGRVWAALAVWRRLGLHRLLAEEIEGGQEEVGWDLVACVLALGRFCAQASELGVAERWYASTALPDILGVSVDRVNESRLYRGLDQLLGCKDAICRHLQQRWADWFGTDFDFLLYDVTSTYFEGAAEQNPKAARGYSRDNRPDCKQVCIGLVVTREGLPVGYEVFAGNRTDVTTLEEIVTLMEEKYGKAKRVWVTDRGIVSEENLAFLRARGAYYLVGTPKGQLRRHEAELLDAAGWQSIREGLEVKLAATPDGSSERFVLCRSRERAAKERAMLERQIVRLRKALEKIDTGLRRRPSSDAQKVERRIGRWLGRNPAAERVFEVEVAKDADARACGLLVSERTDRLDWASLAQGAYLLRTNHASEDPSELWKWYIQLTQAESAFRTSKSDLVLRPVFHHKEHRVDAHILVCFLALAIWRTLEQWLASNGLGTCARQFLLEMDKLHSLDVILPTDTGATIHLRTVSKPEKPLAVLLAHLGLQVPQTPKQLENVVQKN